MVRILLLGLLVAGLLGCASGSEQPAFEVAVAHEGDAVETKIVDNTVIFAITSKTGIGSADIALTSGEWPETILFRLYLAGLEDFKFAYGDAVVTVSVTSSGQMLLESVIQAGQPQMAAAGSVFYMPVRMEDGYFELEAPADFWTGEYAGFEIRWIDFYR